MYVYLYAYVQWGIMAYICVYVHTYMYVLILLMNVAVPANSWQLQVQEMIQKFDEHTVANTHKFGVIYQTFNQVITDIHNTLSTAIWPEVHW